MCVIIFQSTLGYLSSNSIVFNQKSTRFEVLKPKTLTINFPVQSFEISDESIAAI